MKKQILLCLILSTLYTIPLFSSSELTGKGNHRNDTLIEMDSATFLVELDAIIHAIAFDHKNNLYVGGKNKVYSIDKDKKIITFAELTDTTNKTIIWGMTFDLNGNLFIAAQDRIIKIDTLGTPITLIREDFGGPCGVSDVRIDSANNLYIAYDNIIAQYDTALNKKIIVNGNDFNPPIEWAVGIEFDNKNEYIFVGDCNGKKLYIIPYKSFDYVDRSSVIPSNWGQYLTKDEHGNIYLSMHGPETFPEFLLVDQNLKKKEIYLKKRPYQAKGTHKKAIAYGQYGSYEKGIYCIIGNKIYIYPENRIIWK